MDFNPFASLIAVIGAGALAIGFVIWIIKAGVREGIQSSSTHRRARGRGASDEQEFDFELTPEEGPGRYKVDGVDKETAMDTTVYVRAQSMAAARIKAELQGVMVAQIEWLEV